MKNEDVKVIVRALCIMSLTLFINLVFVHLIVYASPAMEIEAFDAAGHEVIFNDGGYAVNAGPVRFVFNEDSLYGELAISLGMKKDEVGPYVHERMYKVAV